MGSCEKRARGVNRRSRAVIGLDAASVEGNRAGRADFVSRWVGDQRRDRCGESLHVPDFETVGIDLRAFGRGRFASLAAAERSITGKAESSGSSTETAEAREGDSARGHG